ncbi:MAG: hypothetical protein V4805_03340 [Pseudomonadota bacterium]
MHIEDGSIYSQTVIHKEWIKMDIDILPVSLPFSVQIYSLRAIDSLDQQLDAVAAAGFQHVELTGAHLDNPSETVAKLNARG